MKEASHDQALSLRRFIPQHAIDEIEHWIKKYPSERKRPPIIAALKVVQSYHGNYLTEASMKAVAEYLDVPDIAVYEVATFYSMFQLDKVGRYVISVCNNISCSLRGASQVIAYLQNRLNIQLGETSSDGLFTIQTVECMAACSGAPMLEVNKIYYENLTEEKIDKMLSELSESALKRSSVSASTKAIAPDGESVDAYLDDKG